MQPDNRAKLVEIFTLVLELSEAEVDKVRRIATQKWDSLAHVTLISAMESEFGIVLDVKDHERMTSFAAVELLLTERGL